MIKTRVIFVAVAISLLLVAFTDRSFAQAGCSLLDKSKQAQFILYEKFSELFPEVRLRRVNNTNCSIVVETDNDAPIQVVRLSNGEMRVMAVSESKDGITVPLHYLIQNRRRWKAPESAYGWGDTVFTYDILAGQSIVFSVPLKHFEKQLDVVVPFNYSWENNRSIGASGGVNHHVSFLVEDLPKVKIEKSKKHD